MLPAILKLFFDRSRLINIQDVYDHADAELITVAKPYVVQYQQTTMLFVYFIQRGRKIAHILHWSTTKQTATGVIDHYWIFFLCKMLSSVFHFRQHFINFGEKIFNNDLDASHYLIVC